MTWAARAGTRASIALGTCVAISLALASGAVAQDRASSSRSASRAVPGEVLIVLASELPGLRDPRLSSIPALQRAPFSAYRSMALLSSPQINLVVGQAREIELPNGRRIRLLLRSVTDTGRFRLQVSVNRPGEQDYLPELNVVASPGDPFFIAGQSFREGTLVIGIRLGQRG